MCIPIMKGNFCASFTYKQKMHPPVGTRVYFDGIGSSADETGSYDPDNGSPYGGGRGIDKYYWKYGDDPNSYDDGGESSHVYDTAGIYEVALYVVDDDNDRSDYNDYCEVWVYKIDKVVKEGYPDEEGPLYVAVNDTVDLEAIPYPNVEYYPTDETIWDVNQQPAGADALLNPDSNSLTTTLSELTVDGEYKVKAACGPNDPGDEITIIVCGNPSFAPTFIAYKKAGYDSTSLSTSWLEPPRFEDVKYDPALACYCDDEDHRTSLGNGFDHAHFPVGFPFSYDIDEAGDLETITAADSRAFWDTETYSSYTFVSAATCVQNCHGFVLGLSTWINGSGMTTILADDYVELFGDDISQATFATKSHLAGGDPGHSIKIVEWEDGKIKEIQEKMGESPVYKKTYSSPIDPPGSWRYWKPKPE